MHRSSKFSVGDTVAVELTRFQALLDHDFEQYENLVLTIKEIRWLESNTIEYTTNEFPYIWFKENYLKPIESPIFEADELAREKELDNERCQ